MNVEPKPRRPWVAALLTLPLLGLGQLYAGEPRRALAVYLGFVGLMIALFWGRIPATFVGLIASLLALLLYVAWVIWDAARIARLKRDYVLKAYNRWYLYIAVILIVGSVPWSPVLARAPIKSFEIPSGSMKPSLLVGDYLYADMTYYRSAKPERGDLIVYSSPEHPKIKKVGRAIGLEGERIEIRDKAVYIDGKRLEDPWARHLDSQTIASSPSREARRDQLGPEKIPAGTFFVLGDNRDNSYDSRFFGPVPLSLIWGHPLYVYWSPDRSRIGARLK